MKNALNVAHYFLKRLDREAGDTRSPLKLQKILYYAQAWSLVLNNNPLFTEEIEAWVSDPVVREVWNEYQAYKYRDIPEPEDYRVNKIKYPSRLNINKPSAFLQNRLNLFKLLIPMMQC